MNKYILKRIGISLITVLVLVTVVFILVRLMPGDPFSSDKLTPEVRENLEKYYGFDKPITSQYFTYVKNLFKGDLGYSMIYSNLRVNDIIKSSFPYSFDLGIRALSMAISIGLVLGIIAALNRGKSLDFICIIIAIIGTSMPDFIIGALLQYGFGIKWGLLPVAQYQGIEYTILPSIALGFYTLALVSRVMRASMVETVYKDYIKTAKSKGISQFRVVTRHQIKNAILPVITILGPVVAAVLTGTFVIESIYAIPGMGKYYVQSVQTLDYPVILGMTLFFGTFLVVANMVVDILYGVIDPRIKLDGK